MVTELVTADNVSGPLSYCYMSMSKTNKYFETFSKPFPGVYNPTSGLITIPWQHGSQ